MLRCAAGGKVRLDGKRCSLPSPMLFADDPATPLLGIDADFANCALLAETVWWLPGEKEANIHEKLRWKGADNLFSKRAPFLTTDPARFRGTPADAERAWPGVAEERAVIDTLERPRQPGAAAKVPQEQWNTIAAPWQERYPNIGADFRQLWP
jgi:hypothetical protein